MSYLAIPRTQRASVEDELHLTDTPTSISMKGDKIIITSIEHEEQDDDDRSTLLLRPLSLVLLVWVIFSFNLYLEAV